jgi:PilZ domain
LGTFTDLRISGCYVELKATFPAGALIDMELELNGIRAQVTGEVRASYPFLGMGVAFRNRNPENRQQLAAMIESLRPSVQRVVARETMSSTAPVSLPIILNPAESWRGFAGAGGLF